MTAEPRSYESPLRAAQRDATRNRVLEAAVEELAGDGVDELTIPLVARRAGVSVRTVYVHFPTKDALFEAIAERVDEKVGVITYPPRADDLPAFARSVFAGFDADEKLFTVALRSKAGREVAALLPEGHLDFFLNLELFHTAGDALCVHAGVNPTRSLEAQDEEDLLWIRGEFILHSHGLPWTVVFGHTPQRRVLFDLPYKIGIDTGLVYGGMLSCIELREKKLYQVARNGGRATVTDVSEMW